MNSTLEKPKLSNYLTDEEIILLKLSPVNLSLEKIIEDLASLHQKTTHKFEIGHTLSKIPKRNSKKVKYLVPLTSAAPDPIVICIKKSKSLHPPPPPIKRKLTIRPGILVNSIIRNKLPILKNQKVIPKRPPPPKKVIFEKLPLSTHRHKQILFQSSPPETTQRTLNYNIGKNVFVHKVENFIAPVTSQAYPDLFFYKNYFYSSGYFTGLSGFVY